MTEVLVRQSNDCFCAGESVEFQCGVEFDIRHVRSPLLKSDIGPYVPTVKRLVKIIFAHTFLLLWIKKPFDFILFLAYLRRMNQPSRTKELLEKTGIGQTELSTWLRCAPRTVRHYVKGDRTPDPGLILLLEYLEERPEAIKWFRDRQTARDTKAAK